MRKLDSLFLNQQWIEEVVKSEVRKYREVSENDDEACRSAAYGVRLQQRSREVYNCNAYRKKEGRSQIRNLNCYLMTWEKEQTKPEVNRKTYSRLKHKLIKLEKQ